MDSILSGDKFFDVLLSDTEIQYKKSPVFQRQLALEKQWSYSICATPITKGNGVIFGINWGGDGNFQPQQVMPSGQDIVEYHFIKQYRQVLEKLWGLNFETINFNYTNLCFFRTPNEKYLSTDDYKLSLPLFEKYIRYISPPWILSIGLQNIKLLTSLAELGNIKPHFDKEGKFKGYSGQLWDFNIFSVPHPSAHLKTDARQTIWEKVSNEMRLVKNL